MKISQRASDVNLMQILCKFNDVDIVITKSLQRVLY